MLFFFPFRILFKPINWLSTLVWLFDNFKVQSVKFLSGKLVTKEILAWFIQSCLFSTFSKDCFTTVQISWVKSLIYERAVKSSAWKIFKKVHHGSACSTYGTKGWTALKLVWVNYGLGANNVPLKPFWPAFRYLKKLPISHQVSK